MIIFSLAACETDPIIYYPSDPVPVVYAVFDDRDSIHKIVVTKSFGAEKSPADFGFNRDSVYWDSIQVKVGFREFYSRTWTYVDAEKIIAEDKDSGFFLYPYHEYYQVAYPIRDRYNYYIDWMSLNISIPGHPEVSCLQHKIDTVRLHSPKYNQKYLFMSPSSPILFQWDWFGPLADQDTSIHPHAWNEFDANFEFIEKTHDGLRSQWVTIQNNLYNESEFEKYRELNITYEEFIREVLLQIEDRPDIIRRKLGIINLHISGGDYPMKLYMDQYYGTSDYNQESYTNLTNAMGIFGTSTHVYKDSLRFDYETKQILVNENRLKKLGLSLWTE